MNDKVSKNGNSVNNAMKGDPCKHTWYALAELRKNTIFSATVVKDMVTWIMLWMQAQCCVMSSGEKFQYVVWVAMINHFLAWELFPAAWRTKDMKSLKIPSLISKPQYVLWSLTCNQISEWWDSINYHTLKNHLPELPHKWRHKKLCKEGLISHKNKNIA